MDTQDKLIERLEKREKDIRNQLRKAKAAKLKKEAEMNCHKDRIIGTAIRIEMDQNAQFLTAIKPIIDKHTTNEKNRKILGLEPLQKKTDARNDNTQAENSAHKPETQAPQETPVQNNEDKPFWR